MERFDEREVREAFGVKVPCPTLDCDGRGETDVDVEGEVELVSSCISTSPTTTSGTLGTCISAVLSSSTSVNLESGLSPAEFLAPKAFLSTFAGVSLIGFRVVVVVETDVVEWKLRTDELLEATLF